MTTFKTNLGLYLSDDRFDKNIKWYIEHLNIHRMVGELRKQSNTDILVSQLSLSKYQIKLFTNGSPNKIVQKFIDILN